MVQKLYENRRAIRPIDREKMRPWLMKRLDKNMIKGLEWIDAKNKIFQVTWRHASHHQYSADSDSSIFKCWAEHTGKFKPGDKCNAKNWKANFRCALNSLKNDIIELKDQSVTKGGKAVRIYQFLDEKNQGKASRKLKTRNCLSPPSIKKEISSDEDSFSSGDMDYFSFSNGLNSRQIPYSIPNFNILDSETEDVPNKVLTPIPVPNFNLIVKENTEDIDIMTLDGLSEGCKEEHIKIKMDTNTHIPIPNLKCFSSEFGDIDEIKSEYPENYYYVDSLSSDDVQEVICSTTSTDSLHFLVDDENNIIMSEYEEEYLSQSTDKLEY